MLTTGNAIWYIQGAKGKRKIHRCKQENAVRRNTVIYGGDIIYTLPVREIKEDMPMQNFDEPFHFVACRDAAVLHITAGIR